MIVKKIGIILVYKLKLYKLIKLLTLPLILLAFTFPFTEWNFNQAKQKYQFQQPSLRTKIFDLDYQKSDLQKQIKYQVVNPGTKAVIFPGMLSNQCILLVYPYSFSQSTSIRILHQTIKNDNKLAKNIVLLSYNDSQNLKQLFSIFLSGNINLNFGTIRSALHIDNQIRNKQNTKQTQLKAFFEIYGKNGIHVDVDYFQSIKELLQRLHVQWTPCEEIYQYPQLKNIKKVIYMANSYFGGSRSKISFFLDHLLCQGYNSAFGAYDKSQEILMEQGFQSSSLTFLINGVNALESKNIQNSQKIAKLTYSFAKQFSMQQDHLHSSSTLFYPINNHYFISLVGTIYAGVILLLVGAVHVIGYLAQNSENIHSKLKLFNLIEIIVFCFQYKSNGDLSFTLVYLLMKLIIKSIWSVKQIFIKIKSSYVSLQYLLFTGFQVLLALYFSIFNFSLFYLTGILMSLMLIKNKRSMIILFSITLIACVSIYFDIIKTNLMIINQQNLVQVLNQFYIKSNQSIKIISMQVKIIILPFLYGISTYLF